MKNNWILGHWNGRTGIFHQNIWVNGNTARITDDSFLISIETPKKITMRSSKNNSNWINIDTSNKINIPNETGISINNGKHSGEASDFNFAYLAIYDRILNSAEKEKIKKDLVKRFVITKSNKNLTQTGWVLVRSIPAQNKWFKATDQLRGTDKYREPNGEFSNPYNINLVDEFKFESGDKKHFLIASKDAVIGSKPYANDPRTIKVLVLALNHIKQDGIEELLIKKIHGLV